MFLFKRLWMVIGLRSSKIQRFSAINIIIQMSQRKNWTQYEDSILKKLKNEMNITKWSQIAMIMEKKFGILERTGKQCRERYENHLREGIDKSPWTYQEEIKLLDLHLQHGNKWVYIADQIKQLGNFRTGNNAKNYYMSLVKKSLRNFNKVLSSFKKPDCRPIELNFVSRLLNLSKESREKPSQPNSMKLELCKKIEYNLRFFSVTEKNSRCFSQQIISKGFETWKLIKELKQLNRRGGRKPKKSPESFQKFLSVDLVQDSTDFLRGEREQHMKKQFEAKNNQICLKTILGNSSNISNKEGRSQNADMFQEADEGDQLLVYCQIFLENKRAILYESQREAECLDISEFFQKS